MAYMKQLQSGLRSLVAAGEAGRHNVDGMLEPLNGAVGDINEAAAELTALPVVGEVIGAKLQRTMRTIGVAQAKVNKVLARYDHAVEKVVHVQERVAEFSEHWDKASAAINRVAGRISPSLGAIVPTSGFAPQATPPEEAVKPYPHLLILQPLQAESEAFYFNLDTAAFHELKRSSGFNWNGQERLSRSKAQQAVSLGDDRVTISGAIYPNFKGGLGQLQRLRSIARQLKPLSLSTGYGEMLGTWCLVNISEEQNALMAGGIPGRQGFTLEFTNYGDDMQNV
ncbi:phage tail protein [Pseudomonas sp. Marseille-P9899]|uniref:phage tail protein n=1 Tax=Pseudomonas sp. Marseille-P9899 TaxID=2730401 RepID=UPI00158E46F2|nr:phage tail protein [Pseudomonas sp. Marseille-P9899]